MTLLGIDFGGTKIGICIGTGEGQILRQTIIPTNLELGFDDALARTRLAADALLDGATPSAVGLSAPGPVDLEHGLLHEPPNMKGWKEVPLRDWAQSCFHAPVGMNNDANTCALAEYYFGQHAGTQDIVFMTLSSGLGAGIISDGKLVQGTSDAAGEVGHHILDINGPPCACGKRGCFEAYCGGHQAARRLQVQLALSTEPTMLRAIPLTEITFKDFADAARANDSFANRFWTAYLDRLAQGIGNMISILNPRIIFLGTIAVRCEDILMSPLLKRLPTYVWPDLLKHCKVRPTSLGKHIGHLSTLAIAKRDQPLKSS